MICHHLSTSIIIIANSFGYVNQPSLCNICFFVWNEILTQSAFHFTIKKKFDKCTKTWFFHNRVTNNIHELIEHVSSAAVPIRKYSIQNHYTQIVYDNQLLYVQKKTKKIDVQRLVRTISNPSSSTSLSGLFRLGEESLLSSRRHPLSSSFPR